MGSHRQRPEQNRASRRAGVNAVPHRSHALTGRGTASLAASAHCRHHRWRSALTRSRSNSLYGLACRHRGHQWNEFNPSIAHHDNRSSEAVSENLIGLRAQFLPNRSAGPATQRLANSSSTSAWHGSSTRPSTQVAPAQRRDDLLAGGPVVQVDAAPDRLRVPVVQPVTVGRVRVGPDHRAALCPTPPRCSPPRRRPRGCQRA